MKRIYKGNRPKDNIKKLEVLTDEEFLWIANTVTCGLIIKEIEIEFRDEDVYLKFGKDDSRVSIGYNYNISWNDHKNFHPTMGQVEVFKFLLSKGIIDLNESYL